MLRLVTVLLVAAAIIVLTLMHIYWLALTVGVVVGAGMFLLGMAAGGGLGNARAYEKKPGDVGARIGVALAAMSIAVVGLRADGPYPPPFRLFCGACQAAGALIAIVLAIRYRQAPDTGPRRKVRKGRP